MPGKTSQVWTGAGWVSFGPSGQPGKSAYQVAVDRGYTGTLEQWMTELAGPSGPAGPAGPSGPMGPSGADGISIPPGGTTGQVLVKKSNSDYDYEWATVATVPNGSPGA